MGPWEIVDCTGRGKCDSIALICPTGGCSIVNYLTNEQNPIAITRTQPLAGSRYSADTCCPSAAAAAAAAPSSELRRHRKRQDAAQGQHRKFAGQGFLDASERGPSLCFAPAIPAVPAVSARTLQPDKYTHGFRGQGRREALPAYF